ncbi:MAG: 30S ribosomal protein S17 [Patescibacteria group bacterium]|nr:30S ribosomal protein S17 [Patescibacteria group bacterium]MDD5121046.1 30S ribosomal protein S17 [Patescibacteria group bacterium]MDD5221592.1 30S ribosomal protein S17 [Patescibacteria group bacterium]MDD5396035.1 30S ribosomal protein S17 [Patescibacteria group bacterium]
MKRRFQGIVVSDKMAKTIVVVVEEIKQHSKYLRRYKIQKKFKVHDENKQAKAGDLVIFEECRPLSKGKRWQLVEVVVSKK